MGDVKGAPQARRGRGRGARSVRCFSILVCFPRYRFDKQADLDVVAFACRPDDLTDDLCALDE